MTEKLGKLEKVGFTEGWKDELELDEWLVTKAGIALLEAALDMDQLDVVGRQEPVGAYRADIVLQRIGQEDSKIVIENQRGETNHDHLGKVLTYAAGLGVRQVVWIAEKFRDEHRATLDWLNDRTDNETGFTGLEIELWEIDGAEPPAPKLNVVSHVNEWSRSAKNEAGLSDTRKNLLNYWRSFKNHLEKNKSQFARVKVTSEPWTVYSIGKPYCHLQAVFRPAGGTMRTELYFLGANINGHGVLDHIEKTYREKLDGLFKPSLDFVKSGFRTKSGRIVLLKENIDITKETRWPEYHQWYQENLELFDKVFKPILEQINPEDFRPEKI